MTHYIVFCEDAFYTKSEDLYCMNIIKKTDVVF